MSSLPSGFVSRHLLRNYAHDIAHGYSSVPHHLRPTNDSIQPNQTSLGESTTMGCLHGFGYNCTGSPPGGFYYSVLHSLHLLYSGYLPHSLELVPTSLSFRAALFILGFAGDTISAPVYQYLRTPELNPQLFRFRHYVL